MTKSERGFSLGGASIIPRYRISWYCFLGTLAAGLAARMAAVTVGLVGLDCFAAGFASSSVIVNVVCFFFLFPLSISSLSSVVIWLSGLLATPFAFGILETPFAFSVREGAVLGGFVKFCSLEGAISVGVVGSFFVMVVLGLSLSGVDGGVGCARRLGFSPASGVMAVERAAAEFRVGESAKDSLVCRTTLLSVSFAFATFVCLVLSPRLGEGLLLLAPLVLRRFLFFPMVDCSRGCGRKGCVEVFAVLRRVCVSYLLLCRFVLFTGF